MSTQPRPPRPVHPPLRPIFPPPWLREAGAVLAIVGSCAVAVGLPCAIVGIWVPSWLAAGLWCSGVGLVLMAAGIVAVVRARA